MVEQAETQLRVVVPIEEDMCISFYLTEKMFRVNSNYRSVNVAVYCDTHIKQMYILCGQNTGFLKVTKKWFT
jgi:hypothetical protein